ncbi:ParA family protein [Kitasatospora sp. NBC_00240]|uniref:ParA family protein n=1 Tax=Kitasatospora sp. NBC_00240 TaxID=2903567 RepID=UPI00224FB844|nr:ParA family protein [Kitasatospora sp. NBC_00240]MCX5215550.1 ParA family protein [Kitasatospora sp. NBC_00240]
MASPYSDGGREKVASKLPVALRQELKTRSAQLGIDMQDAVTEAVEQWRARPIGENPTVDTAGAESWNTWLPAGLYDDFKLDCTRRDISFVQGLAQAVRVWVDSHAASLNELTIPQYTRRIVVCNQKGGVGKTTVAAGLGQAIALGLPATTGGSKLPALPGRRTLLVDYDPQGHLTSQLGVKQVPPGSESLVTHMVERDRVVGTLLEQVVPISPDHFDGRLFLLPSSFDAFLLDSRLGSVRGPREASLQRALAPLEEHFDIIVIDAPPNLGLAMDAGLYYGHRRKNEAIGASGVLIPVEAEDSSADAYAMLDSQIRTVSLDYEVEIDRLGLVVNKFDKRKGYVATSSLDNWQSLGSPPVVAVVPDLKHQREAVHVKQPLLMYAPTSTQAQRMREIRRRLG